MSRLVDIPLHGFNANGHVPKKENKVSHLVLTDCRDNKDESKQLQFGAGKL